MPPSRCRSYGPENECALLSEVAGLLHGSAAPCSTSVGTQMVGAALSRASMASSVGSTGWLAERLAGKPCRYAAIQPPSTNRLWPVRKVASSLARKRAALATSSGVPSRGQGVRVWE